jgi:hypothetical protein
MAAAIKKQTALFFIMRYSFFSRTRWRPVSFSDVFRSRRPSEAEKHDKKAAPL